MQHMSLVAPDFPSSRASGGVNRMLAKPLRAPLIWRGGASALAAVRDYLDPISIIGLYIFVLWLWLMSAVDRQDFRAAFDSMLARSLAMRLQMRKALVPSRWRALALRLFQLSKGADRRCSASSAIGPFGAGAGLRVGGWPCIAGSPSFILMTITGAAGGATCLCPCGNGKPRSRK